MTFGKTLATAIAVGAMAVTASAPASADTDSAIETEQITYSKHISRIIQEKCQECHHPGAIAPFSITNYRQARGWSRMVREVVSEERMPPWHADERYGHFKNDRSLTAEEKDMILTWIDSGMPRGNPEDMPEPKEWNGSWKIGEPEMVVNLPEEVEIQSTGVVPYMYFTSDPGFEEDMYITKAQALPGNHKVVHHIIITWYLPEGVRADYEGPRAGFLVGTAPGDMPLICPDNHARFVPAGAHLRWQMHYTPTGKTEHDRSKVGFIFAEEKPDYFVETESPSNHGIMIPPHAENHKETWTHTVSHDMRILSFMPHMHLRGKSFRYEVEYPDESREILLNIPFYDFNWQAQYHLEEPKFIPAGSKIHTVAHYDNSEKNPYNPDPRHKVGWGDQTWEEMMIGWYDYVKVDPAESTISAD